MRRGSWRWCLEGVSAAQLEMRQSADGFIQNDAAMVEDFLKLCCRFAALMSGKVGFSSQIDRIQIRHCKTESRQAELIRRSDLQRIKRLLRV